jgi:glycosyltransferase involved in cell wall biosynthesis
MVDECFPVEVFAAVEFMRIACFVPYATSAPGVRSRILPLMSELAGRGHKIVLVSPYESGSASNGQRDNGVDQANNGLGTLELRCGSLGLLRSLSDWGRRVDLVYIFKQCLGSAQYGWALASISRVPILLDIDDYVTSGSSIQKLLLKDALIRLLPIKATKIVVASLELLNLYEGSSLRQKTHYIPNSVDLDLFQPVRGRKENSTPTFAWPGDLNSLGMCELIIRALAGMKNDAELIIIGEGHARSELQKLAADLDVGQRVRFVGPVTHFEVPSILAGADAGLLPLLNTLHDRCKCPIKLYEYMAMELPVVSVDFGEASHVISDVGCGLTSHNDPNSLARAMDQVVEELGLWRNMGRRGRQYLVENQNWDILSRKLEQVLTSMTSGR